MTQRFLPLEEVFVNSNKTLEQFINVVTETIQHHISHVEDKPTEVKWMDLMCNGIASTKPITVTVLAQILEVTDKQQITQMGTLIRKLFDELPVLENYFTLVRTNLKSFYVKRLKVDSNVNLLTQIRNNQQDKIQPKKVQATLTQTIFKSGEKKNDKNIDNMIQENVEEFEKTTPSKSTPKKSDSDKDSSGAATVVDLVTTPPENNAIDLSAEDKDGFVTPKNTVPFSKVGQKYNQTFALVQESQTNSFGIMMDDIATDVDTPEKEPEDLSKKTPVENPYAKKSIKVDSSTVDERITVKDSNITEGEMADANADDSDVSYSSSSKGSKAEKKSPHDTSPTIVITHEMYDTITNIIGSGRNEELSEELLTAWIENKIKKVANDVMTPPKEVMDMMYNKMHKFVDKDFHKMKTALKTCQLECEIGAMKTIRNESMEVFCNTEDTKKNFRDLVDQLHQTLAKDIKLHRNKSQEIYNDLQQQCKDFLHDHILHRREIFTNQKASFDKDIKLMKEECDKYMKTMKETRLKLEEEVYAMKAQVDVCKTELQYLREQSMHEVNKLRARTSNTTSIPASETPPTNESTGTLSVNNTVHSSGFMPTSTRTTNDVNRTTEATPRMHNNQNPTPMHATSHMNVEQEEQPNVTQYQTTFNRFDKVRIKGDVIKISEAIVRNTFYKEGHLWYEVSTRTATFKFPSEFIHNVDQNVSSEMPQQQERYYNHTNQEDHYRDEISMSSTTVNETTNNRHTYDRKPKSLMPNQFRFKDQPEIKTIQINQMLRFGKDWTTVQWKDPNEDPKDFYEGLKARVQHYGIYLKSYMKLTRESDVCLLTSETVDNFEQVYPEMSNALFTLVWF